MKQMKFKIIIPLLIIILAGAFVACNKDFLNKKPLGSLGSEVLANKAGVDGLLIGAYHMLTGEGGATSGLNWGQAISNWQFGSVPADESYKGSVPTDQYVEGLGPISLWIVDGSDPYLESKWQANYDGIQRANDVIRQLPLAPDVTADEATEITAESRFLRGVFHVELKKVFGNIPYVDESITVGNANYNVTNIDGGGYVNAWPQIEADFQFAIDHLPATQNEAGRANKSAAQAFLAKCYMMEHNYASAKPILEALITGGVTANGKPYALNVHYEDNFNAATDNSAESVFACQSSVNDGSGTNGNYGDNLNFPNSGGPGGCCGFNNPSISLANAYKTDANGLPLVANDAYNTGKNVSDPTNPYTGTLDPRIDWVMGRPGIPYLDWGPHPGAAWIRDPSTDGYFNPKKNAYALSQQGSLSSTETSFWGPTQMDANNYNIIRFADVVLWAAECEVEIGSTDQARLYVNMVRDRAANPVGWVYKNATYSASSSTYAPQTTPADNYSIGDYPAGSFSDQDFAREAVRFERKLELAMEGQRFFDLQRYDNGTGYMADKINAYIAAEFTRPTLYAAQPSSPHFTKGRNEIFPIPQNEIDIENQSGTVVLKQNPGY